MFVRCVWVPLLRLVCETQEDCLCDLVRSEFSAFPSRKSMCTTTHTHLSKRHAKIVSNAVRRKLCAEFQYFSPYFPQQTKNNSQFFDGGEWLHFVWIVTFTFTRDNWIAANVSLQLQSYTLGHVYWRCTKISKHTRAKLTHLAISMPEPE